MTRNWIGKLAGTKLRRSPGEDIARTACRSAVLTRITSNQEVNKALCLDEENNERHSIIRVHV